MKRSIKIPCSSLLLLFLFALGACGFESTNPADIKAADSADFTVDLRRVTLDASELGTIPGRKPALNVTRIPGFATRAELIWSSSDETVAAVDSATGEITVRDDPVENPVMTMIRVESVHDASVYAQCSLTVYPVYPARRRWNFPVHPTGGGSNSLVNGDYDAGNGGTILQATGGGSGYNSGENGPGWYAINPEDPYEYGLIPSGGPRAGLNWDQGSTTQKAFYRAGANYFGQHPAESAASAGHLRTGGPSRFMRIAALQGPFTIIVNYMSNGTAGAHADIRVGDREGIRMEGEGSQGTSDGQSIWYVHETDEFVPLVYLESNTGLRVYDVYVLDELRYKTP